MSATQTQNQRGFAFPAGLATLAQYRRVRISSGTWAYCGASDTDGIGVLTRDAFDTTTPITAEPFINGQFCAQIMVASGAITQYSAAYADSNGEVAGSGTVLAGLALTAAVNAGDYVVVAPSASSILGSIARSALTADTQPYAIALTALKTHATMVGLGSSAGTPSGDFGLTPGTSGTNTPLVIGEAASGNAKSDACRFLFELPPEYVAAGNVTLRIHARVTGLLQVAETIAATAYLMDGASGAGSTLIATAAQTLTATMADYDFVITGTTLVPGSVLDILITGAIDDTGGTANKLVQIGLVSMRMSIKG